MKTITVSPLVKRYKLRPKTVTFCPLGDNYYLSKVEIDIELDGKVADLLDVENLFKKDLNGRTTSIEDLASNICETIVKWYSPISVRVECVADTHIEVHAIAEWHRKEEA